MADKSLGGGEEHSIQQLQLPKRFKIADVENTEPLSFIFDAIVNVVYFPSGKVLKVYCECCTDI